MKRRLAALAALWMLLPIVALGEGQAATANGVVKAEDTVDVTAPFSGTLLPFTVEKGDEVAKGEALFSFDTLKVYAPENGVVTVFAEAGDSAEDVTRRYGMLASIEKTSRYLVNASTRNSNSKLEYKDLHVGETLYFKQTSDEDIVGEGRVIATNGSAYTVEISRGVFESGKRVKLYRDENRKYASCVGEGDIVRAPEAAVHGTGRVVRCAVKNGQQVQKGELLFETVAADCDAGTLETTVVAEAAGVIDSPQVISGQQVYKGQLLVTVHDSGALKAVAEVDEVDLHRIKIGDTVSMVFDSFPDQAVEGTVSRISRMGVVKQNATYYDVDISFTTQLDVRLYMNVTVTLP